MAIQEQSGRRRVRIHQVGGWHRVGLIALTFAVISAIVGLNVPLASAVQISGAITNVVITPPANAQDALKINENWCVPNGTTAGDTFSQTLPAQLGNFPAGFNMTDAAGDVVATATISTATPAVVTYTMTSYAETHQNICGTVQFAGYVNSTIFDGTTQQLVVADTDGTSFTSTVTIPMLTVIDRTAGRKTGAFSDPSDQCRTNQPDCVIWRIESPIGPIDSGTMSDTAVGGQLFDCSKVVMYLGDDSGPNQAFANAVATTAGITISCTTTTISATYGSLATDKMLQLAIPTSLTIGANNGGLDFHNTATIDSTFQGKTTTTPSTAFIDSSVAAGTGSGTQTPTISIDKWSTADGETAGAFDTAPGKAIALNTPTPITMTITNTGTEPLVNVDVTDTTTAGPVLTGLTCDFSPLGGPSSGVTWNGPFAVKTSFNCTGTVPAMSYGVQETDTATVTANGQTDNTPVTDKNPWNGKTPTPVPSVTINKYDTADGPVAGAFDTAPGKAIPVGTPVPITMAITNTGPEALDNVTVSDATTSGPALTGLTCDFSTLGGPSSGVTWAGPFAVGASFDCTGTVPAMTVGVQEADTAMVAGTGAISLTPVSATNPWNGYTPPPNPAITIVKGDVNGNAADTSGTAPNLGNEPASVGLVYTVTNNGNEPLKNIVVTDQLVANGTVTGLACDFSALGGPATGTTWAGPLAAGASFPCTAKLSGVLTGTDHEDIGSVTGSGVVSGTQVSATNPYYATATATPPQSGIVATTTTLAFTGTNALTPLWLGGGLLIMGGLVLLATRRVRRI